jgi:methionyl-tRNA formyltransferase
MPDLKIIFFGTSEFAVPVLESLLKEKFNIAAVVTQPDKPQGRKQILGSSPVKKTALLHNLPIIQPEKLDEKDIKQYKADLGVLVSYGQILNKKVLHAFPKGIVNIHPSLLPKYRGPSPIQYALLNKEKKTGVSIMKLDEGMDSGDIIAQKTLNISDLDDYLSLHDKLSNLGAQMIQAAIIGYNKEPEKLIHQIEKNASYSKIIIKKDGEIKLSDDIESIKRKYKAFKFWPGIFFYWKEKRFKIIQAKFSKEHLSIEIIQPEGKKAMPFSEFLKGYPNFPN